MRYGEETPLNMDTVQRVAEFLAVMKGDSEPRWVAYKEEARDIIELVTGEYISLSPQELT